MGPKAPACPTLGPGLPEEAEAGAGCRLVGKAHYLKNNSLAEAATRGTRGAGASWKMEPSAGGKGTGCYRVELGARWERRVSWLKRHRQRRAHGGRGLSPLDRWV